MNTNNSINNTFDVAAPQNSTNADRQLLEAVLAQNAMLLRAQEESAKKTAELERAIKDANEKISAL